MSNVVKVECLICGYFTSDKDQFEMWANWGQPCDHENELCDWYYTDGKIVRWIGNDQDGDTEEIIKQAD
jgi:hypothetical protein